MFTFWLVVLIIAALIGIVYFARYAGFIGAIVYGVYAALIIFLWCGINV